MNSILVQSMVKNLTLNDSLFQLRVAVGVADSSDVPADRPTPVTAKHGGPELSSIAPPM